VPAAVLDGVREQLADEQPDGEAGLRVLVEGLEAIDGGPRLADRGLGRRQVELQPRSIDPGGHAAPIPSRHVLYPA
jgi:hypothetical protein